MKQDATGGQMMQWMGAGAGWVALGSAEHARAIRLHDFLWDHAALLFGEAETFTNVEYRRTEGDCQYCGGRKHFRRRDAALTKDLHKMGYFTELREKHPSLTLDHLEQLLAATEADRDARAGGG